MRSRRGSGSVSLVLWTVVEAVYILQLMSASILNNQVFKHMGDLHIHNRLCRDLLSFFYEQGEIDGAFISGSGAAGGMDLYSDLDLGFVCPSLETKERVWSGRFDWKLPAWFHRMDADHVKPYFIIYLFEPHIHVDLAFYTKEDLPPQAGGPFTIAFDKKSKLNNWNVEVNRPYRVPANWSNVVHEEEQFWTWTHYSWCHSGRGEYYDDSSSFHIMRGILERWYARLNGTERFDTRRLEQRGETAFIEKMRPCFPQPDRASMKSALLNMIGIHNQQRDEVNKLIQPEWKTTQAARDKITQLIRDM